MAKITVPVNMNSEQKNILGVISTRQLIYIAVGVLVLYAYVPTIYSIVSSYVGFVGGVIGAAISALPVAIVVLMFGFVPVSKFNMNRDIYTWIKIQSKLERGSWRKGS